MVTVHFQNSRGGEVGKAGPFPWVHVFGESLRAGPRGDEIARHRGSDWITAGCSFTSFHVHGSTCILGFEGASAADTCGPFDKVEFIDGAIYGQPGRVLLAQLDEQSKQWYAYRGKRSWPGLVIEKCVEAE